MIEALPVLTGEPRVIILIGMVIFFAGLGSLLWWNQRLTGEILLAVVILIGLASIFLFPLVGIIYFLSSYYQARPLGEIAIGIFGYLCGAAIGGLLTFPTLILSPSPGNGPSDIVVGIIPCFAIFVVAVVGLCLNSLLMFAGVPQAAIAVDIIILALSWFAKRDDLIKLFQKWQEEKYEKELKEYKADLENQFIEAVKSGDVETVNSLIQSRIDFLKGTVLKPTTLQRAVEHGRIEVVKALIQAGAQLRPWLLGCVPNENTALFLVEAGIEVNSRLSEGSTALITVTDTRHTDVIRFLIEAGADVNAQRDDGWTALIIASLSGSDSITKRLVDPESNKETWVRVPTKGHVDTVKVLIEAGADVNAKDKEGRTVLMYASTGEIAKILIEAGAELNAKDQNGETALLTATRKFRTGVVKVLIEAGADVNAAKPNGETALKLAVKFNDVETINVLREAGATN